MTPALFPKTLIAATTPAIMKPNIIFIMADDLGYSDLGCYGQKKIKTPNIDILAKEGIRFTQAYAGSSVCAPSRCSLMTGMHKHPDIVRKINAYMVEARGDSEDYPIRETRK